jgi:general secretion pathway protein F
MPLFRYVAYSPTGKKIEGVIDADSYGLAKERLRREKILVKNLSLAGKEEKQLGLDSSLLLDFTREVGQLLKAGLPLYDALLTIEEKYRSHKSHPLLLDLCDKLKNGSSLSSALKKYPKTFDEIYISMVRAGEETGSLTYVYEQLALLITRQQKLKKRLLAALIYPAFLGSFCLIVIFGLLFFVVPSMEDLFEGRPLHPMTQAVLQVSKWTKSHSLFLLVLFFGSFFSAFFFSRRRQGKLFLQKIILRAPFFKTISIQSSLVRFCRAVSILLSGGVPLLDALNMAKSVLKLIEFEELISQTEKAIVEGKSLSSQVMLHPLVPSLVVRMIKTGEETGQLGPMLQNIAEIYEGEVEKSLDQMTTLLQPVLLLILGAIVGLILLSILLPLTDVSSFM